MNPKDMPDFGCRWLAGSIKPVRLIGLRVPMVGGQRKNQSLRESITDLRDCYSPLKCNHGRVNLCVYAQKKKH